MLPTVTTVCDLRVRGPLESRVRDITCVTPSHTKKRRSVCLKPGFSAPKSKALSMAKSATAAGFLPGPEPQRGANTGFTEGVLNTFQATIK